MKTLQSESTKKRDQCYCLSNAVFKPRGGYLDTIRRMTGEIKSRSSYLQVMGIPVSGANEDRARALQERLSRVQETPYQEDLHETIFA